MAEPLEQLANRTVRNIRLSTALVGEALAVRQAAVDVRRQAAVLCRFSAIERQRRAKLAARQANPSLLAYLVV